MLRKTRHEMTGIEPMVEDVVEEQKRFRHVMLQRAIYQLEIIISTQYIQHLNRALVRDLVATESDQLVKDRECVTHSSVCLLRHHVQRLFAHFHTFVRCHFLQVRDGIGNRDAVEVIHLATTQNRRQHFVLLRGRKDEDGI